MYLLCAVESKNQTILTKLNTLLTKSENFKGVQLYFFPIYQGCLKKARLIKVALFIFL